MQEHESNSANDGPEATRHQGGNIISGFLRSFAKPKEPVYVDGYMKKGQSEDFVMFSESPRSATWSEIAVRNVRELEYFGREFIPDGVCAKVRLTL